MTILKPPCAPFLDMFGLSERMQDSQGQVRTQRNALELLEVAMWVALTQHQTGRKFLFEHPAYASSWNTQMVSLVTGLEGVMLITVDLCTLGMADEDERSHCRMTTIMTNDSLLADAFRPYRCARDHNYASAGSRHSRVKTLYIQIQKNCYGNSTMKTMATVKSYENEVHENYSSQTTIGTTRTPTSRPQSTTPKTTLTSTIAWRTCTEFARTAHLFHSCDCLTLHILWLKF